MIVNVPAHRRANAFAQALEERSARGTAPERPDEPAEAAESAESAAAAESAAPGTAAEPAAAPAGSDTGERSRMLAVAESLADLPAPQLDPEVKTVHRARLVAAMEAMARDGAIPGDPERTVPEQRSPGSHRAGHRVPRPRSRLTKSLAAGGLTLGVAAGAFSGVAAASSDALPGDSLYGLKRGMEDVKLGMAASDSDRGGIYLDQASTRLSEARRLMERDRSGPLDSESVTEVRHALSGMQHDAAEGRRLLFAAYRRDGSLAPIERLSDFSRTHRGSWTALRDRLPHQLGDVRDQVTSVFDAIDQEVGPLQPLLPPSPSQAASGTTTPYRAPGSSRPYGSQEPSPSTHGSPSGTGSPGPTASDTGGFFGTGPGNLFDPPLQDMAPSAPIAGGSSHGDPVPEHDVVLPPLLPGLIQDSGISTAPGSSHTPHGQDGHDSHDEG